MAQFSGLVFLVCTGVLIGTVSSCSQSQMQVCEQAFFVSAGLTQEQLETGSLSGVGVTRELLTRLCQAQKVFDQCLKPFEANCSMEQMIFFEVIDSLYDYICNQSFEAHVKHSPCFSDADKQPGMRECTDNMTAKMRVPGASSVQLCQAMNEGMHCTVGLFWGRCGEDALQHMHDVIIAMLKPTAKLIRCQLDPDIQPPATPPTGVNGTADAATPTPASVVTSAALGGGSVTILSTAAVPGSVGAQDQKSAGGTRSASGTVLGVVIGLILLALIAVAAVVVVLLYKRKILRVPAGMSYGRLHNAAEAHRTSRAV